MAATLACTGDPGNFDAAVVDSEQPDTTPPPDSFATCSGQLTFTGDYVDWDSSESGFLGIADATWTQRDDPSNKTTTAPNGRGILCLPRVFASGAVEFAHPNYRTSIFTAAKSVVEAGIFSTRGIGDERLTRLFTDELGLAQDNTRVPLVLIEIRSFPGRAAVLGATVSLAVAHGGAFTQDAMGMWVPGNVTTDSAYVMFANVDAGNEELPITVTPPKVSQCVGPPAVESAVGSLAAALWACQ